MNKVVLVGRLTRDPELKYISGTGTAVTTISLAVDKYNASTGQREADFIPVVIWGKQAENTANYTNKGSLISICGRIQTRSYDAKDGTKRYVTEVVASEIQFLGRGSGSSNERGTGFGGGTEYSSSSKNAFDGGFDEDMTPVDDGDIPF